MKDYEKAILEEERQDRLQKELEYKRYQESSEAEANWRYYQRKQEEDKFAEMMDEDDFFGYLDDDCYYLECEDDEESYDPCGDLLDAGVPDESNGCYRPTEGELYNMYANACEEFFGYEPDVEDDLDDLITSEYIKLEVDPEELRISRKSIARNRHLNEIKAKKKSQKTAEIFKRRYWKSDFRLPYEEYRLYTRATAAIKKANRVKVS